MTQRNYTDQELVAMPRVNLKLLDEVLDYIIDHPDEWNQASWSDVSDTSACGTTFCFAGHACVLSGVELGHDANGIPFVADPNHNFWTKAEELLGLTQRESDDLFIGTISTQGPFEDRQANRLVNVKVEVEKIRARAKAQEAAFNRIAQEFIDAAGLDDVVRPGYTCPESAEVLQGTKGGANE